MDKVEALNSYFKSVFTNESNAQLPNKGSSPRPSIQHIEITSFGILKLLKDLNIHKPSGPDCIRTRFLKEIADVIAPILEVIFTASLTSGKVPND